MKQLIIILLLTICLTSCEVLTGKKITITDPVTGAKTVTYEDAPIENWVKILSIVVPGLGVAAGAAARLARNAARARDGMIEANEEAIKDADWSQINTAASFKILLNTAQKSHKDAKLLANTFKKWKAKKDS